MKRNQQHRRVRSAKRRASPRHQSNARSTGSHILSDGLTVRPASDDTPAEILFYNEIGRWGITADAFRGALELAGPGALVVHIHLPGGDFFDAVAIYNALRAHPGDVRAVVDGMAASGASLVVMAGAQVDMDEAATLIIHSANGFAAGTGADFARMAAELLATDDQLAAAYHAKCGMPVERIKALMQANTWITAAVARANGFCDDVVRLPLDIRQRVAATTARMHRAERGKALAAQEQTVRQRGWHQPPVLKEIARPHFADNTADLLAAQGCASFFGAEATMLRAV